MKLTHLLQVDDGILESDTIDHTCTSDLAVGLFLEQVLIVRARVAACRCATSLLPARERPQLLRSGADEKHPYEQQLQGSKCPHLLQTQEAGAIPTTRVQAKSQCKESQRVAA